MDLRLIPSAVIVWVAAWLLTARLSVPNYALLVGLGAVGVMLIIALIAMARQPTGESGIGPRPSFHGYNSPSAQIARHQTAWWLWGIMGHAAIAVSGMLAVGISTGIYQQNSEAFFAANLIGPKVTIVGKVISEPRKLPFGNDYVWTMAEQTRHIQLEVSGPKFDYQSTVQVTGTLTPTQPGGKAVGKLSASSSIGQKAAKPWWRATNLLRKNLVDVTAALDPQGAGLVPGMAIGDTSRMPAHLKTAFKVSGLSHLTAVSGGHFSVILVAIGCVAGGLRLSRGLRVAAFAVISTAFVMLVRPDPAVIRAAAMCAVGIIGTMRGRKAAAIPALGASVLVLLALDPWLSRSYGFALSAAASFSLAMFATPLAQKLQPWLGRKLAFLVAVPLVAQGACAPIILLFSDGAATTTVLANLLVGPAVAPATLLSLAATMLAPLSPWMSLGLAKIAAVTTGWIAGVATFCANMPGALIPIPSGVPSALLLLLGTVLVAVGIWRWQPRGWPDNWRQFLADQRKSIPLRGKAGVRRFALGIPNRMDYRLATIASVVVAALFFTIAFGATKIISQQRGELPPGWQVAACDVGQGDATVVRTGTHSAILIDVGNDDGAADRCLKLLGISQIDLLVISHYHSDHVGGLNSVLTGHKVIAAMGPGGCGGEAAQVYLELAKFGVPFQAAAAGASGAIGQVNWLALGHLPPDAATVSCSSRTHDDGSETELNNQSLVFYARVENENDSLSLIALGDLETQGQANLLTSFQQVANSSFCPVPLTVPEPSAELTQADCFTNVDIAKVAHHGSAKQSAALATYLAPRVAVFSVGAHNTYGHPTRSALELFESIGATNVRTDECGTSVFTKVPSGLSLTCLQ